MIQRGTSTFDQRGPKRRQLAQVATRKANAAPAALTSTAAAAFQPNIFIMKPDRPAPLLGDHHDGRRGEGGERAADRDVDEQHAKRRVHELLGSVAAEELVAQQQGRERHRRRLGDERAEQRTDRQHREIVARCRRQGERASDALQDRPGKVEDRPARGDDHDDEDEGRFGEAAALQVGERVLGADLDRDQHQQHHRPEAEHDLDLAEQMPEPGVLGLPAAPGARNSGWKTYE